MIVKYVTVLIVLLAMGTVIGQTHENDGQLPYFEMPAAPDNYSEGGVVARMIDGLGFRYYWATEGLRSEDLAFKPSTEARSSSETIDHILNLSLIILNSAVHKVNEGGAIEDLGFSEKRSITLKNLKRAADIFRQSRDLDDFTMVFKGKNGTNTFPFWYQINGPIADAIWHCGQVVSFRRSSGNPFNAKVSVLTGKLRE